MSQSHLLSLEHNTHFFLQNFESFFMSLCPALLILPDQQKFLLQLLIASAAPHQLVIHHPDLLIRCVGLVLVLVAFLLQLETKLISS